MKSNKSLSMDMFISFNKRESKERRRNESFSTNFKNKFVLFFVLIIVVFALATSCNKNKVFEKHHKLDNYSWNRFNKIAFDVDIKEAGTYDIYIAVRYIHGVPYRIIPSGLQIIFPEGEERYNDFELSIRNKDGSYKGEVAGDIWDCPILVLKNYSLSKQGIYSFIIHNLRDKLETPGIMEIGLIIKKTKKAD